MADNRTVRRLDWGPQTAGSRTFKTSHGWWVSMLLLGSLILAPKSYAETITVPAGGNFQAALNRAKPGDVIQLQGGATYEGSFHLPNKSGSADITIESSELSSLPPENVRVNPSYAKFMPKLVSPSVAPIVTAENGAHNYRFVGIEFHPAPGKWEYDMVQIGRGNETSLSELPRDFVFDRDYIHGDPTYGSKRGIALNGINVTVENSYISGIAIVGQDAQALCGWNGPGPFNIINNYLEASGENVLFGGARAFIPNLIPSDIVIRHNHFFKPLSWKVGDPSYAGIRWDVKNLLEFKNAQRVTVEGNILENCWIMAQHGSIVLFTPRTNYGQNPWVEVQDIKVTDNIIRHAVGGIDFMGIDGGDKPQNHVMRLHRILIQNNLLYDLNGQRWGTPGNGEDWLFVVLNGSDQLTINHNTGFSTYAALEADGRMGVSTGFKFTNNIFLQGKYGFFGGGVGDGNPALAKYFPGAIFGGNVVIGGASGTYPKQNYFPASLRAVRFQDAEHDEFSLLPSSPYHRTGTDGKPAGADVRAVLAATAGAIDGNYPRGQGGMN
jgi:hypothetical protein